MRIRERKSILVCQNSSARSLRCYVPPTYHQGALDIALGTSGDCRMLAQSYHTWMPIFFAAEQWLCDLEPPVDSCLHLELENQCPGGLRPQEEAGARTAVIPVGSYEPQLPLIMTEYVAP